MRARHGLAFAAALAAATIFACDGYGTQPGGTTSVTAIVTGDGSALAGVAVALFEQGGTTALENGSTGGDGRAEFGDLSEGSYDVEITVPDGFVVEGDGPTRKTVEATESQPGQATFALVSGDTASPPEVVEVHMTSSFTFESSDVTITEGTRVEWINDAAIFHTITPDGHSEWERATVSSAGDTFTHTFNTAGRYEYYCEPHRGQGMTGVITVQTPDQAAAGAE